MLGTTSVMSGAHTSDDISTKTEQNTLYFIPLTCNLSFVFLF